MKIKLHAKAEQDLREALDYYFEIDSKLEKKFINYLEQTFNKILKFPNLYQYETKTAQKALMDTSTMCAGGIFPARTMIPWMH